VACCAQNKDLWKLSSTLKLETLMIQRAVIIENGSLTNITAPAKPAAMSTPTIMATNPNTRSGAG